MKATQINTDLLLLTAAAGMLDALSYLRAGVFTANMTGNTVLLGLGLALRDGRRAAPSAISLGAFIAGALIASIVLTRRVESTGWDADVKTGLGLELPFLAAFCVLWLVDPVSASRPMAAVLVAVSACALGIQSVAVRRLKIHGVVTTFITGTITSAVVGFLTRSRSEPGERDTKKDEGSPLLLAGMVACYLLAAGAGAALYHTSRVLPAVIPLAATAAVAIRSYIRKGQRPPTHIAEHLHPNQGS